MENDMSDDPQMMIGAEEDYQIFYKKLNDFNNSVRAENLLSSWMRNSIIIFTLGITINTFSVNKYKNIISHTLFLVGLIFGIFALLEYNKFITKIYSHNYDLPKNKYSFNFYSTLVVMCILTIYFIMRLFRLYL
jgi:uncharacterized membrane protein YidH (DUF202 family)